MAYSVDLRRKALRHYSEVSQSIRATASAFDISPTTLHKWILLAQDGQPLEPKPPRGWPRKLNDEERTFLVELTRTHSGWTQRQYAEAMNEHFGLNLTQPNICRALKRLGISFKKNRGERIRPSQIESAS